MKTKIVSLSCLLILALGLSIGILPAQAADNSWSSTACWGGPPYSSRYNRTVQNGQVVFTDYWNVYSSTQRSLYGGSDIVRLWGPIRNTYVLNNSECGRFGMAFASVQDSQYIVKYFYNPNTPCALRWIYEQIGTGVVGENIIHNAYC